jgi:hypothetical protein
MKRFVLVFVLALPIILLMGCNVSVTSEGDLRTQIVGSFTAESYTLTPASTPDPLESSLVMILNTDLARTNQLSQALEAKYYVLKVDFLLDDLQVQEQLFIEIHCECVNNAPCCSVNRTFVALTDAMKSDSVLFSQIVPLSITTMQVSCYDHEKSIGTVFAPWNLMREYFFGTISGFELGGEINKSLTPSP